MAIAVLRSQSYLRGRLYDESVALNPSARSNSRVVVSNVSPNRVSRRRRRSPGGSPSSGQDRDRNGFRGRGLVAKVLANNLVMGQVKILKRGEKLNNQSLGVVACENRKPRAKCEQDLDMVLGSTSRLGPDPEMVNKQIRVSDGLYAGSGACFQSPAPSSVPLPAFLGKNGAATSDLRRLLKLDFA